MLLVGPLPAGDGVTPTLDVQLAPDPGAPWLGAWWAADPRGDAVALEALAAIMERIQAPRAFATAVLEGRPVGVALGVAVDRLLVLECIATLPESRRRGVASATITALASWAGEQGTTGALLAVQESNAPARALYRALGLVEAGAYAYARPAT